MRLLNLSASQLMRPSLLRSRVATLFSLSGIRKKKESGSVTEDLKHEKTNRPYGENTGSGTIPELKDKKASFDPHTVDPKKEMDEMRKETDDSVSPLDWSGANEKTSPQTNEDEEIKK
ncbi:uncharacterized protein BYT42DRAFT_618279 [Radiomyces spectabilis]|uniref:uncharacterized protein n=1 Tax=Radiomyces spectabilis TaxID=64574 RepID=UPI00221F37FD|nr:uncharacterized protein BYT42DRAFT_618279 [Radiomyces spectabilis]KAI8366774.1 hypothetical protein BYT42DRAFT_618279 [Radiomyces spectabilis]